MAVLDLPVVSPDRDVASFRPFKAMHHFRNLVADKEDTKEVFFIIEALKGRKIGVQAKAFLATDAAHDFMQREETLPIADMLDDHDRWADCASNSVARHYIDFMKREGLTANGLVDESYAWSPREDRPKDQIEWYVCRIRDTHDLYHVLTSYGRDALGEASLLGFSYSQNHNLGVRFIGFAGAWQIRKVTGTKAPVFASVLEGQRLGKAAAKITHQDIEALMHEDIDAARKRLNIGTPTKYRECLDILEGEGNMAATIGLSQPQTV